ncbi:MAG TPA: hypothetical protein VL961_07945 [Acidimicrobiales bacterium]|nr:hypothetical protein [Acidimicrobiales bacterium]
MGLRTVLEAAGRQAGRAMPARAYLEGLAAPAPDVARFLILTSGRSGSELLVTLLNSHPQIACDGEYLLTRRLSAERFMEGRAARARRGGKSAYGIKALPAHFSDVQGIEDPVAWVRRLSTRGWKMIRLRRANRLDQAISSVRANRTDWHFRQGQAGSFVPMAMDPNVVVATMYVIEWTENQIDELFKGLDVLDLTYERDLETSQAQSATVGRIASMLGVAPAPTSTDLVRVNPRQTRDMVTNYDEIVAELRRNRFAEYAER